MNIRGSRTLDAPRDAVFARSATRTCSSRVIPGCQRDRAGQRHRVPRAGSRCGCPGMVGSYRTVVRVVEADATQLRSARGRGRRGARLDHGRRVVPARRDGRRDDRRLRRPGRRSAARWPGSTRRFVEGLAGSLDRPGPRQPGRAAAGRDARPASGPIAAACRQETAGVTVTSYFLPRSLPEALDLAGPTRARRSW